MTSQAIAGVLSGLSFALAVAIVVELTRHRRDQEGRSTTIRHLEDKLAAERDTHRRDLERRLEAGNRLRADLELERRMRLSCETRLEEAELERARRRLGPIVVGETVALTTPGDRTIRGVVRDTFDNGAILLGAATVYIERTGRGGEIEIEELDAGDVVVPAHRWAQKLPPAPLEED